MTRVVAELEQVQRQQQADEAVAEGAQAARGEQAVDVGGVHGAPDCGGDGRFGRDTVLARPPGICEAPDASMVANCGGRAIR